MVPADSWRDHFKIDEKILKAFWDEFSESSPIRASELTMATASSSTEFVLWCVREGHFTEEAFTQFQSEQFNLPIVRVDFFSTPVDHAFWDRVKDIHPWTAACLPLGDWDGHLLIGAVWPTETLKSSILHRLVLGTPSRLREFHSRLTAPSQTVVEAPTLASPEIKPEIKPEVKPASKPKFDSGDPFAALSRQLGIASTDADEDAEKNSDKDSSTLFGDADAPEGFVVPEGLVIPEGLVFSEASSSEKAQAPQTSERLATEDIPDDALVFDTSEDTPHVPSSLLPEDASNVRKDVSESGTVVHNFETGNQEVVERKKTPLDPDVAAPASLSISDTPEKIEFSPEPIEIANATGEPALSLDENRHEDRTPTHDVEPMPELSGALTELDPFDRLAAELKLETLEPEPEADLDATQPSIVPAPQSPSPKFTFSAPPVMPFAPIVTPSAPAMVKPLAPSSAEAKPAPPAANPFAPTSASRPAAEATIVVKATSEAPAKIRKPLFEPATSAAPINPDATINLGQVPMPQRGSTSSPNETQSGHTGTAARTRRLESTPVTSFFGIGGPKSSGRVRNEAYSKRAIAISKVEPMHLDQSTSVDEAGVQALLQSCNLFETSMILLFKDGELMPWKWSDLFLSVNGEKPEPVELKEPSIFKVVFRTAKPYHGYVVTSTTNQKFFNEFYRGMLPKHATVIPIMIDGRMGGMLLGFTNSKIDYRQSLRLMERLAFDLGRVFKTMRGPMAKAS